MGKKIEIEVTCPTCGIQNRSERWEFIDARENPEMKAAVRSGEAFIFKCPSCDTPYDMDAPFAYYEPNKHIFLMYANNKHDYDIAYAVLTGQEESMNPDIREVLEEIKDNDTINKRLVYGRDELFEKLTMIDHSLDDGVMEILKIAYGQKIAATRTGDVAAAVMGKGTTTREKAGSGKKTPEFDYIRFFLDDETKVGCLYLMKDKQRIAKMNTSRVAYNSILDNYGTEIEEMEKGQCVINFKWGMEVIKAHREKQMAEWQ